MLRFVFPTIIAILFFACKAKKEEVVPKKNSGNVGTVNAVVAEKVLIDRSVQSPGAILPFESTDMHPEISGRVVAIHFSDGAYVKQGQLLVKLFDADLQAQLKKLNVQLRIAETTEKRQKELLAVSGTSQQDMDNAVLSVANIKADINILNVNIEKTNMRAPFAGKLGFRNISMGAYISPASIITNIAQISKLKVEFSVPEKYAADLQIGASVPIKLAENSNTYTATIIALENTIAPETRNLRCKAVINNPDRMILPGTFIEALIDVGSNKPAIMIPTQSVIPTTRFKKVLVCRNGSAVLQTINTGFRDSARIEVIDGLQQGDTVLTTGLLSVKEGQPLKIRLTKM